MALKTITGKLARADGVYPLVRAYVAIAPSQATVVAGTSEVVADNVYPTVSLVDGTYTVSLQANSDLTPLGTYYTVSEQVDYGPAYTFSIIVPGTAGPFVMSNIQTGVPPTALPTAGHLSTLTVDGAATLGLGSRVASDFFALNPATGTVSSPVQGVVEEWGLSTFNIKSPLNPTPAKGDGITDTNAAIGSGTATLSTTSSVGPWGTVLAGQVVIVMGAGYNGQPFLTTVLTVTDSKHLILAANATTTVSAATVYIAQTKDTAAFNAVLAALPASGGVIELPSGVYWIDADISYTLVSNQHVRIEGLGEVVIISSAPEPGAETGGITFVGGNATERLTFRNFKFYSGNTATGLHTGILLRYPAWPNSAPTTRTLQRYVVEDVTLSGWSRVGMRPIYTQNGRITNCSMTQNRNAGMFLLGDLNVVVFGGDYSGNVTGAITGDYGIAFDSSSVVPYADGCKIIGVQANTNGRKGLDSHHSHNTVFLANTCKGNGYCGIYAVTEDLTKDSGDIQIAFNTIDMTGASASLKVQAIQAGSFGNPNGAQLPGVFEITHNIIKGVDANGRTDGVAIWIDQPITGPPPNKVLITNNQITNGSGSAAQPILINNNAIAIPYVKISDNTIHTVACADLIRVGAATQVDISDNIGQVDSGTPGTGIFVPATATGKIADNELNGAAPTTPISAGNTVRVMGNSQNGNPLGGGWNPSGVFGDGSDGVLVFDGVATVVGLVPSASVYLMNRDILATTMTVNAGVTIRPLGYRIFATQAFVNKGLIRQYATDAVGATGGAAVSQGTAGAQYSGSATCGTAGATGTTGVGAAGTNQAGGVSAGGAGGAGGNNVSVPNAGGAGGTATGATAIPQLRTTMGALSGRLLSTTSITGGAGGGAGGGDGTNAGGGGGSGAPAMCIAAAILDNTGGVLRCKGGAGAAGVGGNAAGGGGGGGGYIVLIYSQLVNAGTLDVSGGALGAGVGTGANGVAGSSGTLIQVVV